MSFLAITSMRSGRPAIAETRRGKAAIGEIPCGKAANEEIRRGKAAIADIRWERLQLQRFVGKGCDYRDSVCATMLRVTCKSGCGILVSKMGLVKVTSC